MSDTEDVKPAPVSYVITIDEEDLEALKALRKELSKQWRSDAMIAGVAAIDRITSSARCSPVCSCDHDAPNTHVSDPTQKQFASAP